MNKYSTNIFKICIPITLLGLVLSSCHKDSTVVTPTDSYANAPSSYNFSDANYKQQSVTLSLADTILNDLEITGQPGATAFSSAQLQSLYDNTSHLYSSIATDVSLSQLTGNGVFFSEAQARSYFDSSGTRSENTSYLGTSSANTLANGLYLPEYYEKLFMGAVIYNQANLIFAQLSNANNDSTNQKYGTTDMIHLWDELFGYMGMPVDYPTWTYGEFSSTDDSPSTFFLFGEYIGHSTFEYTVFTSKPTSYIPNIFKAFIVGRMAIKNKDYATRDTQLAVIKDIWEKIIASQAISYAQNCIANIQNPPQDPSILKGRWSEMTGFIHMFQFNQDNKLGNTNINLLYSYIGNKPADATVDDLNSLITLLKTTYGF